MEVREPAKLESAEKGIWNTGETGRIKLVARRTSGRVQAVEDRKTTRQNSASPG